MNKKLKLEYKILNSPLGKLVILVDEQNLRGIYFYNSWSKEKRRLLKTYSQIEECLDEGSDLIEKVSKELNQYFNKKLEKFDLPIQLEGSVLQLKIWKALLKIPFGQTCSYSVIALRIKNPKAVRAVGTAIGKNPISIVVPCHRVVAKNGTLGGYGGGLKNKEYLLNLESEKYRGR